MVCVCLPICPYLSIHPSIQSPVDSLSLENPDCTVCSKWQIQDLNPQSWDLTGEDLNYYILKIHFWISRLVWVMKWIKNNNNNNNNKNE